MAASTSDALPNGTSDSSPFVAASSLRSAQNSPHKRRSYATDADGQEFELGPAAMEDDDDIAELESSIIRQSRTIEDFTRIIAEWRSERERVSTTEGGGAQSVYGGASIVQNGEGSSLSPQRRLRVRSSVASLSADAAARMPHDNDGASLYSYEASSVGDPDEAGMSPTLSPLGVPDDAGSRSAVRVRCTCCCGRGTRRCKRARRATREWSQMESDLHLAAQIGQALLRRSDALHAELTQAQEQHGGRINSMMKKLTSSIKETGQLAKRLEQSELNMEACEASNRALVRELDEARRELTKAKGSTARNSTLEMRLERAEREVEDLRQELSHEQKNSEQVKTRAKRAEKLADDLQSDLRLAKMQSTRVEPTDRERTLRKEEIRKLVENRMTENGMAARKAEADAKESAPWVESLVAENDGLMQENKQMKELLDARNDELTQLRDELSQRSDFRSMHADEMADRSDAGKADAPLRLADIHLSTPQTALSDEIVDVTTIVSSPSMQTAISVEPTPATPGLLSPYTPNSSLPSASTMSSSVGTITEATVDVTPNVRSAEASNAGSVQGTPTSVTAATFASLKKETRTAQLVLLIDMIARLFTRLSTADVDTMAKRLQRQKLTGDVGHLARTTVNGILRDVDGLRDHFRRSMDTEAKGRDTDNTSMHSRQSSKSGAAAAAIGTGGAESESLVARKEFFALIKVFKDIFLEMARLRNAINEVSMQPQHASRILQEQLGVQVLEDKGVSAWFGRLLSTTGLPGATTTAGGSVAGNNTSSSLPGSAAAAGLAALGVGQGAAGGAKPSGSRTSSGTQLGAPRAAAAVTPSAVAVEVKGMHAFESSGGGGEGGSSIHSASPQPDQGSFDAPSADGRPLHARPAVARRQPSLSRVQSRNLSGLFVGSMAGGGGGVDSSSLFGLSPNSAGATGGGSSLATRHRISSDQSTSTHGSRLSRIVDDDELSIHHTSRARTLRPRNLSDSSMHTTYLEDGEVGQGDDGFEVRPSGGGMPARQPRQPSGLMAAAAPTPAAISRIVTPSTLSLQATRDGQTAATATTTATTAASSKPASSGGGLLSSFVPARSVAKAAFNLLSPSAGATAMAASPTSLSPAVPASVAPKLRSKSSQAQLALAAATGSGAGSGGGASNTDA